MKNILAFAFVLNIFITPSCSSDVCSKVTCPLNQTCYNGICGCTPGYEGTKCDSITAKKYVGTYKVYGGCGLPDYISEIRQDNIGSQDVQRINFSNFLNLGLDVYGFVNGTTIDIPVQYESSYNISGNSGYYNPKDNTINLGVSYYDYVTQKQCNIKYVR